LAPSKAPTIEDAIARIEETGSWVLLKGVQIDPAYRALLDQFLVEAEELTGVSLMREITWLDAFIFISSPNSLTPYHMDHESNFLFQIHGEKETNLFSQYDRSILTEEEIEGYYVGDLGAATYKDSQQHLATVYRSTPGMGIHQPPLAPHWVRTGSTYSVTLSILFFCRTFDRVARIHQVNHYLRKLGIRPAGPGHSRVGDTLKVLAVEGIWRRRAKGKYQHLRPGIIRLLRCLEQRFS
jgi:hypothetical protein